jgi:signal transduction histidine kinase
VTARTYWKRLGGWATDLKGKYWDDPFFRSELNIVILQIAFSLILVFLVAVYFSFIQTNVTRTVLEGIQTSLQNKTAISGDEIIASTENVKADNFWILFIITGIFTLTFSLVMAKIILRPARNTLNSQKRFISDVAHELRTPLSIIKTNSEVAMLDHMSKRLQQTFKSNVDELDRISEIINNLLSLSKLAKPQNQSFKNVDMGFVIDNAVSKLKDLAKSKQVEVAVKRMTPNTVWGNSAALEQIVMNLLKNAINYSPENSHVRIEVKPDYRGNVILTVADQGIGIKEQDLMHIFEPFYRVDKSRSRSMGSSGLGLTIVAELVKLHHGRITIRSKVNAGTSVMVLLPAGKTFSAFGSREEGADEVSIDFLRR